MTRDSVPGKRTELQEYLVYSKAMFCVTGAEDPSADGEVLSELDRNNNAALQTVWVECDTKVSHLCIFPSDGTNRIRFTGQDAHPSNLSRKRPAPRRHICYAVNPLYASGGEMSTALNCSLSRCPPKKDVIPSELASRGIYAPILPEMLIKCVDLSTPLRFARDDRRGRQPADKLQFENLYKRSNT